MTLRRGRRNCVVRVESRDADTLCTVATGTWVLMPGSSYAPFGARGAG